MDPIVVKDIYSKENYYEYLKENSYWIKIINRDRNKYKDFVKFIKEKYKLRTTDKLDNLSGAIGVLSEVLSNNK